jgi:hypothetical protein
MSMGSNPLFGSGQFYQGGGQFGPRGPYGPWPTCGCSSLLIIIAGLLLVCAGGLQFLGGGGGSGY